MDDAVLDRSMLQLRQEHREVNTATLRVTYNSPSSSAARNCLNTAFFRSACTSNAMAARAIGDLGAL